MKSISDRVSSDCPCEAASRHFKGSPPGHGPVSNDETVVLAVYLDTPRQPGGGRLLPAAFRTDKLNSYDLSLARLRFTTKRAFQEDVVATRTADLVGVASATGVALRRITYDSTSHPAFRSRGVCLVDKVEQGDHDGHAALGWGHSDAELSDKQKKRAREAIKQNLADSFGSITSADDCEWASSLPEDGAEAEPPSSPSDSVSPSSPSVVRSSDEA